jgi:hypothetical protein
MMMFSDSRLIMLFRVLFSWRWWPSLLIIISIYLSTPLAGWLIAVAIFSPMRSFARWWFGMCYRSLSWRRSSLLVGGCVCVCVCVSLSLSLSSLALADCCCDVWPIIRSFPRCVYFARFLVFRGSLVCLRVGG